MTFLERLGVATPIIQAPMAGTSTPLLAARVSQAGALGSIAVGAVDAAGATAMIREVRSLTDRPFNVNMFVHATPRRDAAIEAGWLDALAPTFRSFGCEPPTALKPAYASFLDDEAMFAALLVAAPPVVSFHFGLPRPDQVVALRQAGSILLATATTLKEARACLAAGMDAVVAQGWEAGGHRGAFGPQAEDRRLGMAALTRVLVRNAGLPVIAAGGIMDGRSIRAVLDLGAVAAQLGTAFIACPESAADADYRALFLSDAAAHTEMTAAISGRVARSLPNRFTALGRTLTATVPDYPVAYDAGKALNAAARAAGEMGFSAQWAGQGAPLARVRPASELVATLLEEMQAA
ncbi:NAD(P)H-dependent flavin oxidoreductase [Brevundimonas sp.]|uniref:NAD(P)H-dependent flavin oxidoreductase n=1 Tax=Brevundimonas sp. TaxID=1871086 RepID=UPI003D1319F2